VTSAREHLALPRDPRFERGRAQFNAGRFFAAHETWEAVWLESVGPEKELLQGLVQIAAGYAKVESGIRGGALKLLTRGLEHLRPALGSHPALQDVADAVSGDLDRLRTDGPVSLATVRPPRIEI
jgi:hypothetical protein